jgi:glycosyltransferase involved in cell wall biosynthesis
MKRIAYLLHNFPGITDTFIRREIRSLQAAGVEVIVISVWKPKESHTTPEILADWTAYTYFVLPRSIFSILFTCIFSFVRNPGRFLASGHLAYSTSRPGLRGMMFQLFYFVEAVLAAEILRDKAIQHIHNHIGDQSGTVTMLAANLADVQYSITFHGWPVFFDAKYSMLKEKVQRARFIRAISYFCQSQLMMFAECEEQARFKVIHCGLSIGKYQYRDPGAGIKTIFCAARLSPEKGLTFLLRAMKGLIDKGYDLNLRLAGNGPSLEELKKSAGDLGITDRVAFLGFLNENQIINELRMADLFVLPSFVEGIPVSAMEAMATGVPVIATNIAGTSELVEHGRTGLLVRPSDPQALMEAITKMADDHDFRLHAAKVARKKVVDEFDVDKESQKLKASLLEC